MNTKTMIPIVILIAGLYIEYQKDSSFSSVDTGSLLIGGAAGMFIGHMMGRG